MIHRRQAGHADIPACALTAELHTLLPEPSRPSGKASVGNGEP